MVRALNHALFVMTDQRINDFFVPQEQRLKAEGAASVEGVTLAPVAERPILVTDTCHKSCLL